MNENDEAFNFADQVNPSWPVKGSWILDPTRFQQQDVTISKTSSSFIDQWCLGCAPLEVRIKTTGSKYLLAAQNDAKSKFILRFIHHNFQCISPVMRFLLGCITTNSSISRCSSGTLPCCSSLSSGQGCPFARPFLQCCRRTRSVKNAVYNCNCQLSNEFQIKSWRKTKTEQIKKESDLELPKLEKWFTINRSPSRFQVEEYVKVLNALKSTKVRRPVEVENIMGWFKNTRSAHRKAFLKFEFYCFGGSPQ